MSKKFFWELFNTTFIKSIVYSEKTKKSIRPCFDTDDKISLLPYIDEICPIPDEHFVRRYHNEILNNFLRGSTHLVSVVKALEKHRYRGVHVGSMDEMIEQISRLRLTSTVLKLILAELYREGDSRISEDYEVSIFTSPKTIDLRSCIPDELSMYDYQTEANTALYNHFIRDNGRAGILSMPTGSGKTRVATRFLIETMVADGWQVVWLTHRAMLIEQTADAVYNSAGSLLRKAAPDKSTFKMVCVSGSHASIKATERDDDVMICGVQSLIRNLPYLHAVLGKKVMIIVDEAHHTLAPSYRLIIKEIQKIASDVKLLGLTATPVRMSDVDTGKLMALFDNNIIYSVTMSSLIAKGFLAEPIYETIDTNIDFDTTISLDEQRYIQKWGELSAETMERMARLTERNALIADRYVANKEKYGKTIIFALNATHCIALCEELQKRGVRCDYIYCAHSGNTEKIARFQKGELDVLVNIQVLTEGSDIPDIQTVFLTRPTSSDVLLMQMIGRGMRGPYSKGTKFVNIVDFHDLWGRFSNWLNPEFVISSVEEDTTQDSASHSSTHSERAPLEMFRDILNSIHTSYPQFDDLASSAALPTGWYDVLDEEGNDSKVLVFESQLPGYINMWKNKALTLDNPNFNGQIALEKWFGGFGLLPNAHDIQLVMDMYKLSGEFPHLNHFKERNDIDAALIAMRLKDENVGIADLDGRISQIYQVNKAIIDSIYGGEEEYNRRVNDFIRYPDGIRPLGMKIEEIEDEALTIDPTPCYDIDQLVAEVVNEMFDGTYGKLPPIMWTDKPYSTFYGMYHYHKNGHFIRINCMLNSKSVPKEVVKYVIYHELLHRDNFRHDAIFRALEHKYPNWTEHERFLDFTFPKFDIRYSM